ncbi:MAG: hypothetical protein ACJ72W_08195 [Actinoallomurus sp.]
MSYYPVSPLLREHRAALDRLAALLLEQETVDRDAVLGILRDEPAGTGEVDGTGGTGGQPSAIAMPAGS